MKKIVSFILASALLLLSLNACAFSRFSLKINGMSIDKGIFRYYLAAAENDKSYSDEKDKEKVALELCKEYAAGCELIKKYNVSLSAEEKVKVSSDTKAQWLYFKSFYEKYSVSKQALNKIIEHKKLVEDIVIRLYSPDGEKGLSQKEIKDFFDKNYIAAQIISTAFTDESDIEKITEDFTDMRNTVRSGESMESAAQKYPEIAEYEGESSVIASFDTSYPDGLFESVSAMRKDDAQVYKYHDIIYLIHRLGDAESNSYFSLYSKDCIVRMKKSEVEKMINTIAQSYKMVYNG